MPLLPHLWTITPRLRHAMRPQVPPEARPWTMTIEDPRIGPVRLSGRWRELQGSDEAVVVVHGLGGCTESHYMLRAALAVEEAGLSCLRINLRGCDRQGEDFYHAALTADLHAALASEELRQYRRLYVLGYSLGGHMALRLATEEADPRLAAAAALCAPLDLARSQVEIDSQGLGVYRRYMLGNLKKIYAGIAARRPVPFPVERLGEIRFIREWDEWIVAPRHGFASADDYYARASVAPRLPDLRVPSLLVNAESDPMVPARSVRPVLENPPPHLHVRWLPRGGHVAFPRRMNAELGEEAGEDLGVDSQVLGWLRRQD
ncbi:MAG TPA: alpha/beta fold hydrolase [Thermoanaerobaculia bacterium]|nr:alpha/beta fold hydrolase [Thermoanaerobaculia bacterium]